MEYIFKLTLLFLPALNLLNYVSIDVLNQVHLKGVNGQGEKKEQDVLLKGLSNIVIDAGYSGPVYPDYQEESSNIFINFNLKAAVYLDKREG